MTDETQEQPKEQQEAKIRLGDKIIFKDFTADFLASHGVTADSMVTQDVYEALTKEFLAQEEKLQSKQGEKPLQSNSNKTNEVSLNGEKSPEQQIEVNQKEDWIANYEEKLSEFAKGKGEWQRITKDENGNDIVGLKGKIGDAEIHFTSSTKATANLAGIDMLVHMAGENGQDIKFNDKWTDEFKAKMIEACEKEGVKLTGRPEEQTTQTQQQEQETTPQTKSEPKYKVVPRFNNNRLDQFERNTQNDILRESFEKRITLEEQDIQAGKYDYSESVKDKTTAELLMKKYVLASQKNNLEMAQACETALQRYGVEKIGKNKLGQYEITAGRTYDERSSAEKAKIDEAFKKALPKLNNQDKQVAQSMGQRDEGR